MLALIPARGGSKGLPGKNIRPFAGLPLIAHTIQAARVAVSITRVVVSTDDEAIAAVAKAHGAEVPFLRPAALAGDASPAIEAYLHACRTLEELGSPAIDELVVLLPTSPLRMAPDIDQAVGQFRLRQADAVISVTPSAHPLHWAKVVDGQGVLRDAHPGGAANNRNRQDYPPTFMPNGAIYVFRRALLERRDGYYTERTYPMVMPKQRSIDIDDHYDFAIAEFLLLQGRRLEHTPGHGP
jgi:N-acylneuraminate cytidylyltransferase/CMP-N,N'-diacetyllegionaminic acid synthase